MGNTQRFIRSRYEMSDLKQPAFVATAVLLITALVNIAQCNILNTPNLHGRTALFLYPLFIVVFAGFLGIIRTTGSRIVNDVIAGSLVITGLFYIA
jgi:hypothetical protein